MSKKIIFVDIDGTLIDEYGHVPSSAQEALQTARNEGHLIYLSTGRTLSTISENILAVGFDGIVGAGGSYVMAGDEVLLHEHLDNEMVNETLAYLDEQGILYFIESSKGVYADSAYFDEMVFLKTGTLPGSKEHTAELKKADLFISQFQPFSAFDFENDEISKFSFNKGYDHIAEKFSTTYSVLPYSVDSEVRGGEIGIKGMTKASAIELVLAHLSWDKEHTVAFGDGMNDLEMFEYVGISFAMDNAVPDLKARATYVTDTAVENGIANGLKKIGVI